MSDIIKFENLQDRIIEIRDQKVLLDVDVAEIYGVETKRINEAVKNNPDKFPTGYVIELDKTEWDGLKSKFSTSIINEKDLHHNRLTCRVWSSILAYERGSGRCRSAITNC